MDLKHQLLLISFLVSLGAWAQPITGVWKGRINRQKVEVKIVQDGDSLTGSSYYYDATGYTRYSIKGFFDPYSNAVTWWDDQLIEKKGVGNKPAQLSLADFNCPGGGKMLLEGKAGRKDADEKKGPVDLSKEGHTAFPDEWDYVIENFTRGTNHPDIIDSVRNLVLRDGPKPAPVVARKEERTLPRARKGMVVIPPMPAKEETRPAPVPQAVPVLSNEERYTSRKKHFTKEIPVSGDSLELRFYDNAEVDGDSIALFLNDRMIFQHIRLTEKAYIIKIAVSNLDDVNELVMVAENLGSIPPNTSYMVAISGGERYEAQLASTENSSAVIRLIKR